MVPQAFSMVGLLRSNCRIAKAKGRRHPLTLAFLFLSLCFLTWLTYSILFRHADKCDVTNDLKPLLLIVHDTFVYKGVEYFSDGGTTLGYVRNKGILPNEHDLDVVIGEQDYERLVMLKPYFEAQGLFLYVRGDYIFQKAWTRFCCLYTVPIVSLFPPLYFELSVLPSLPFCAEHSREWKPYLDDYPCGRLYDQHKWYYVDIYCYEEVKGSELADKYPYFKDKIVVENPDDIYHCKER
eukprot:Ihof_evm2s794 gene=Ihof_evmTU2s794